MDLDAPPVKTCDGDFMDASEAREISRKYYIAGFFALPWFWAVNVLLFLPDCFSNRGDPVVAKCESPLSSNRPKLLLHLRLY